jgi:hypothetical protein
VAAQEEKAAPSETPAAVQELQALAPERSLERSLATPKSVTAAAELANESALKKEVARSESIARDDDARGAPEPPAQPAAPAAVAALRERAAEADSRQFAGNAAPPQVATARAVVAPPVEIASPDGSARWRLNGQQVVHFTAAANEWSAATIPSPAILTAGASPAASVCWIVGRGGVVYVTTDGTRFQRLPFPEMADLVGVTAADERTATVSSADGRAWRTTDQGRTWSRQP